MTKEEYLALCAERYEAFRALNENKTDFFSYERDFEAIFLSLGRDILEQNISEVPKNALKKTKFKAASGK